ncbi:hypothetical protein ACEE86_19500, partial [Proteus mirabilis]
VYFWRVVSWFWVGVKRCWIESGKGFGSVRWGKETGEKVPHFGRVGKKKHKKNTIKPMRSRMS